MTSPITFPFSASPIGDISGRGRPLNFPRSVILVGDSLTSRGAYNTTATSLVANSNVVTVTAATHSLFPGASVTIANANEEAFNGVFTVSSVSSTSVFTYNAQGTGNTTATGTIQVINNQSFRDLNFFEIGNAMIGHPFTALRNVGKPGKTLSYIAASFNRDALQYRPSAIQIQGGINDVTGAGAGSESTVLADMKTYMSSMIQQCISLGITPIVHTLCPLGASHGSYSAARYQLLLRFNSWLREYAIYVAPQVILIDAYKVCVNPTDAAGAWASNYSADDIHPNANACQKIGIEMASVLANSYYTQSMGLSSVVDTYAADSSNPNVILNPLFNTSGGSLGVSGAGSGAATNTSHPSLWTGTWTRSGLGTVTSVLSARSDGFGNDIQYTCNPANSGDQISILSNAMVSRVSQGDILMAECNLQISSIAAVSNVFFSIDWSDATTTYTQPCGMITGSVGALSTDFNWTLRTNPMYLRTAPVTMRIRMTVAFSGAATNVVVKLGRVSLKKITAIGLSKI